MDILEKFYFNSQKEIYAEERLVSLIARWIVHNHNLPQIKDLLIQESIVWKRFQGLITYHELAPLAYLYLKNYSYLLPNEGIELLENSYYYCLVYLSYLWQEFKYIVNTFKGKNIEFVLLKGIAFIVDKIYADKTYLRPMCDIDLLIKKEALPSAKKTLLALGYEKALFGMKEDYWEDRNYHLGFIRKKEKGLSYMVELHWALDYKRDKPKLPNLWKRIRKIQVEDRDVYLLSYEDTLFSLALHQRRFGKTPCLKNICDVAMLLNTYDTEFDWDYILKETEAANIRTTLYFVLIQANLLLDIQVPPFILKALDLPKYKKQLIERFILKETFSFSPGLNNGKALYLKSHFLLYDNLWEPIRYILNIPQEQFAKFYGLPPYAKRTVLFYKTRYLYFLKYLFVTMIKVITKRALEFLENISTRIIKISLFVKGKCYN